MGSVWLLTGEARAAKASGIWIFYIGSIALVPTAMRFMHFSEKLKNVSQDHSVTVRGVMGPVSKSYRTTYDYSIFRPSDFEAQKKMHFWGTLAVTAVCSIAGWLFTNLFINQFL